MKQIPPEKEMGRRAPHFPNLLRVLLEETQDVL